MCNLQSVESTPLLFNKTNLHDQNQENQYSKRFQVTDVHELNDQENLNKKAFRKALTREMVFQYLHLRSPLNTAYLRSARCGNVINVSKDGEMKTIYCHARWCLECSRIRTAKMIEKYANQLMKMNDPVLVTLTIRNVPGESLSQALDKMIDVFRLINKNMKYHSLPINGIRKIEATFNFERGDYHPHFHVLMDGWEAGEELIRQWMKRQPDETDPQAQDIRKADRNSLKELFKYVSKAIIKGKFDAEAQDVINQAMEKRKSYQPFGSMKPDKTKDKDREKVKNRVPKSRLKQFKSLSFIYHGKVYDWENDHEQLLIGWIPSQKENKSLSRIRGTP